MPCYHPVPAYRLDDGSVVFVERGSVRGSLTLACGQCVGCRLERSRQWAVRCMHEAQLHKRNCFVTLTYSPEFVPADFSLNYSHFQLFMKRLRRKLGAVRFYMCGEYGESTLRPHFHVCLFGLDFPDKLFYRGSGESKLYTSAVLDSVWGLGFATIGEVTFESAAYTARYVMKKVNGDLAPAHYRRVVESTGEIVDVLPEFCHMSLKPGIGYLWFSRFMSDVYPEGRVVARGKSCLPPKYYDRKFAEADPLGFEWLAYDRSVEMLKLQSDSTPERLAVREQVAFAAVSRFSREV